MVRMCIYNVTVVLVLMHIWKSTLPILNHSYFLNLKFVDPLNTDRLCASRPYRAPTPPPPPELPRVGSFFRIGV